MECQKQLEELNEVAETNSKKMEELIRDLTVKAKKEIEEERATRDATHEEILSYVEETCQRLNSKE